MDKKELNKCLAMIEATPQLAIVDFNSYSNYANAQPEFTQDEERILAKEYIDNKNKLARKALFLSMLRQVVKIVRMYRGYGLSELDLVQEGNIGLLKAVDRYNLDHNVKLVTYATYWIKASIHEFIIRNWKILKIATTNAQRKLFFKLRSLKKDIVGRLGSKEAQKIADTLNVPVKDVQEMEKRLTNADVPFEKTDDQSSPFDDEYDNSPSATLESEELSPEDILTEKNTVEYRKKKLAEALSKLNDRERSIVFARSLAEDNQVKTLQDLSKELGISAERVRQLEEKAMKKIKSYLVAHCNTLH